MAILRRLSRDQLEADYTHYGRFYGSVPVYVGDPLSDAPRIAVRNWWPEWLLDAADWVWGIAASFMSVVNPEFEDPGFMIAIDGEMAHAKK
ncbi:Uncharacterised protein [Achromobacter xylosoxidans]|uniref:hypothetical protein n=1 Tax=Alcaligenes xylosoxydans xylosoxydans TaxID=85698 RepID=UPI0006C45098|nr:hypothetical protein [Achromobacter xylosoxidans]CUJ53450.1 Uncharacterised protein [Achromobacter xylosoxidans]